MADRDTTAIGVPLTMATAGHIDHGKTALIEALTQTNTDRLPEEKRRGISIELGFASLSLAGGRSISVVDVPGHRRLVRAMVAGAGAVDFFLLVIAADDGVMPQTREHLIALRALGVDEGIIALTKFDLASEEALEIAREEARDLAPGHPLVEVSSQTGAGLDRLRLALSQQAESLAARKAERGKTCGTPLMHFDRAFSVHGIGTVVTGTLLHDALRVGQRVRTLPGERVIRIRSIEIHGQSVDRAEPGQRVALNLAGVSLSEVERGDALAAEHTRLSPSYRLDVELHVDGIERLPRRVQVHHGTRHAAARVIADGSVRLAQLRLESPLIARPGDRLVIRRISPEGTLGGGRVIDPLPPRHAPTAEVVARLESARSGAAADLVAWALRSGHEPLPGDPREWGEIPLLGFALQRLSTVDLSDAIDALQRRGVVQREEGGVVALTNASPAAPPRASAQLSQGAIRTLGVLEAEGLRPRAPLELASELGLSVSELEAQLQELSAARRIVRLRGGIAYPSERLQRIGRLACELAQPTGSISLPELRDSLRISRKYAQAILEWLDSTGVTVRRGDEHVLRRPREIEALHS